MNTNIKNSDLIVEYNNRYIEYSDMDNNTKESDKEILVDK